MERQKGIRDYPGSYSRYTPGGTGIPDVPGSYLRYNGQPAWKQNCPVHRECPVYNCRYIASVLYFQDIPKFGIFDVMYRNVRTILVPTVFLCSS